MNCKCLCFGAKTLSESSEIIPGHEKKKFLPHILFYACGLDVTLTPTIRQILGEFLTRKMEKPNRLA